MAFNPSLFTQEIHTFVNDISKRGGGARAGSARIGQVARGGGVTSHFGVTLDKKDFANLTGRLEAYKHIPKAGEYAMQGVAQYIHNTVLREMYDSQGGSNKWPAIGQRTREWRKLVDIPTSNPPLHGYGYYERGVLGKKRGSTGGTDYLKVWDFAVVGQYARMEFNPDKLSNMPSMYKYESGKTRKSLIKASVRTKFFVNQLGTATIPARRVFPAETGDLTTRQQREIREYMMTGMHDYLDQYPNSRYWRKFKKGRN